MQEMSIFYSGISMPALSPIFCVCFFFLNQGNFHQQSQCKQSKQESCLSLPFFVGISEDRFGLLRLLHKFPFLFV